MNNDEIENNATAHQSGAVNCYTQFIEKFGKWSCPEKCKIQDLPFIKDIENFLNSFNDKINTLHVINEILFNSNKELYKL